MNNTVTCTNKSSERKGRAFLWVGGGGGIRATRDRELQTGMEKQKRKKGEAADRRERWMGNKSSSEHDRNQMCGPLRNCKDERGARGARGLGGAVGENQRRNHPGLKREREKKSKAT